MEDDVEDLANTDEYRRFIAAVVKALPSEMSSFQINAWLKAWHYPEELKAALASLFTPVPKQPDFWPITHIIGRCATTIKTRVNVNHDIELKALVELAKIKTHFDVSTIEDNRNKESVSCTSGERKTRIEIIECKFAEIERIDLQQVKTNLRRMGYRSATLRELIHYAMTFAGAIVNHDILALSSLGYKSEYEDGQRYKIHGYPVLDKDLQNLYLKTYDYLELNRWHYEPYTFAVVPLKKHCKER